MKRHFLALILVAAVGLALPAAAQFNAAHLIFVPAGAHNDGVNDSHWRTDLTIANADTTNVDVAIYFVPSGVGDNSAYLRNRDNGLGGREEDGWGKIDARLANIPPAGSVTLEDIIGQYWTADLGFLSEIGAFVIFAWESGTLQDDGTSTPRNITVTSRTYNAATIWVPDPDNEGSFIEKDATYGMVLPGVAWYNSADAAAVSGERDLSYEVLIGGRQDDTFRYNVGIFNTSDIQTSIRVNIQPFHSDGTPFIDSTEQEVYRTVTLGPLGHIQYNGILESLFGITDVSDVTLIISFQSWSSSAPPEKVVPNFTCYGSIVDNRSNDPTAVLPSFDFPYDIDCMWGGATATPTPTPTPTPANTVVTMRVPRYGYDHAPAGRRVPLRVPPRR